MPELLMRPYDHLVRYNPINGLEQVSGMANGQNRKDIYPGLRVSIILKHDQRTGKLTQGVVKDILTKSSFHPHGIKVRLVDGQIGRVHQIED